MERKPGRPRALTVELIAQAALDDGISTFSMPSVARRLGVAHSGLYRYVTDRDDLLIQAIDRAADSAQWPDPDQHWEQVLREIGETVWHLCDTYPGIDRALQLVPRPVPGVSALLERYVTSLSEQGFMVEDAAVGVEFAFTLTLDSSAQMARLAAMQAAYPDREGIPALKGFDNDEVWVGRGFYSRKLDIFLTGLATRRLGAEA
ncbi:MAG: TetR/AcrR family transcriptional regulator [Aeromicrobium sp.]